MVAMIRIRPTPRMEISRAYAEKKVLRPLYTNGISSVSFIDVVIDVCG